MNHSKSESESEIEVRVNIVSTSISVWNPTKQFVYHSKFRQTLQNNSMTLSKYINRTSVEFNKDYYPSPNSLDTYSYKSKVSRTRVLYSQFAETVTRLDF